jgi:iron complex outermembrane recepter protein
MGVRLIRPALRARGCLALALAMLVAATGAAAELEEVLVTTARRPQVAAALPGTISVLGSAALNDVAARDLIQVAEQVPGMVFSRAPDDGLALTLRGVGTPARSQAFDQSVALFLDEVFLAKGRLYPLAVFDVERVEILRGPHSTDVGKNASVGAIHIATRRPARPGEGHARVAWDAERGGTHLEAATDVGIGDRALLRAALSKLDSEGWVRNRITGRDVPADEDLGARLTLALQPRAGLDATLRYQFSDHERIGTGMQLVYPGATPSAFGETRLDANSAALTQRGRGGDSIHDLQGHLASLTVTAQRGAVQLATVTSYTTFDSTQLDDLDFSPTSNVDFARAEDFEQITQELRVGSVDGERIEYVAGLFALDSRWRSLETQFWGVPGFPPGTPIAGQLFNGPFTNDFVQDTRSIALWPLAERWQFISGLRLTDERKDVRYGRVPLAPQTLWNSVINPPFAVRDLRFEGTLVDGTLGLQFSPAERTQFYGTLSRGTKLGGFVETNGVPSADPARDARIESEAVLEAELGYKARLAGGSLQLNVAAFWMDIDDFQDTTFDGTAFVTINVPARSRGAELQLDWRANERWRVSGAATYADAEADLGPRWFRMTQAPRWTANAAVEYWAGAGVAAPSGARWRARLDVRHRDRMFNQRGELFESTAFTPVGALLALEADDGQWGIALASRNLFNDVSADFFGPTPDASLGPSATPAELRSLTLSAWRRFGPR